MVLNMVYNMVDTWFISLTGDLDLLAGASALCDYLALLTGLTGIMLAQPAADLLTGIAAIVIISGVLKEM